MGAGAFWRALRTVFWAGLRGISGNFRLVMGDCSVFLGGMAVWRWFLAMPAGRISERVAGMGDK